MEMLELNQMHFERVNLFFFTYFHVVISRLSVDKCHENSSPELVTLPTSRPRRMASLKRLATMERESSDEFNSNSENEGDASNPLRRPQRQCKSRTKTLVAISIAEQEYDKFDLGKHDIRTIEFM